MHGSLEHHDPMVELDCTCRTKAFLLPRNPTMTASKALQILAKLEGDAKANDAYV